MTCNVLAAASLRLRIINYWIALWRPSSNSETRWCHMKHGGRMYYKVTVSLTLCFLVTQILETAVHFWLASVLHPESQHNDFPTQEMGSSEGHVNAASLLVCFNVAEQHMKVFYSWVQHRLNSGIWPKHPFDFVLTRFRGLGTPAAPCTDLEPGAGELSLA